MTACPYLICRGLFGHPGPHLFEQPDIERLKREAAQPYRKFLMEVGVSNALIAAGLKAPLDAILAEPSDD